MKEAPRVTWSFTSERWVQGLHWWSSGLDATFPIQGAWVQSLVRKLGFRMLHGLAKKKS